MVSLRRRAVAVSSQGSSLEVPLSVVLFMLRVLGPQLVPPLPAFGVSLLRQCPSKRCQKAFMASLLNSAQAP